MLLDTLSLKNEAGTTRSFVGIQPSGSNGAKVRIDSATTSQLATKLAISHSTTGKGDSLCQRHLIQATRVELDANGLPFTTIVNLTISQPVKASNNTTVYDLVSFIKDLVDNAGAHSADLDAILQGQS